MSPFNVTIRTTGEKLRTMTIDAENYYLLSGFVEFFDDSSPHRVICALASSQIVCIINCELASKIALHDEWDER